MRIVVVAGVRTRTQDSGETEYKISDLKNHHRALWDEVGRLDLKGDPARPGYADGWLQASELTDMLENPTATSARFQALQQYADLRADTDLVMSAQPTPLPEARAAALGAIEAALATLDDQTASAEMSRGLPFAINQVLDAATKMVENAEDALCAPALRRMRVYDYFSTKDALSVLEAARGVLKGAMESAVSSRDVILGGPAALQKAE